MTHFRKCPVLLKFGKHLRKLISLWITWLNQKNMKKYLVCKKKCRTFAKIFGVTGNSLSIRGIFDSHRGIRNNNIFKIRRPPPVIPLEQGLRLEVLLAGAEILDAASHSIRTRIKTFSPGIYLYQLNTAAGHSIRTRIKTLCRRSWLSSRFRAASHSTRTRIKTEEL